MGPMHFGRTGRRVYPVFPQNSNEGLMERQNSLPDDLVVRTGGPHPRHSRGVVGETKGRRETIRDKTNTRMIKLPDEIKKVYWKISTFCSDNTIVTNDKQPTSPAQTRGSWDRFELITRKLRIYSKITRLLFGFVFVLI